MPEKPATVKVSARGAARLKSGHPWVYRSDVAAAGAAPGDLVGVLDERGRRLGTALYSSSSQIAIRMLGREAVSDLPALISRRLRQAIEYRKMVVEDTDAWRVVFSEADALPGLIVDRYNDILSVQVLTQAMDAEPARSAVLETLGEVFSPAGVVERVDPRVRELEHLPARATALLRGDKAETVFTMNRIRFHYDGLQGQKTGAFLDQRENYAAAARYARGEALDVFSYHGGFALHFASRGVKVTGIDSSRPALEMAERNAGLNGFDIEWIEANAFDLLSDYASGPRRYDAIVLDPPAFAKTRASLPTAIRGYKELNLRAMKMLRPGGMLATCSCSYHVSTADFLEMLRAASVDAHRPLRIVECRGQARDHPIMLNVPETAYLKCAIAIAST